MNLQTLTCPRCEAPLKPNILSTLVTCEHCQTTVLLPESAQDKATLLGHQIESLRTSLAKHDADWATAYQDYLEVRSNFAREHQLTLEQLDRKGVAEWRKSLLYVALIFGYSALILVAIFLLGFSDRFDREGFGSTLTTGEPPIIAILIFGLILGFGALIYYYAESNRIRKLSAIYAAWLQVSTPHSDALNQMQKKSIALKEKIQSLEYQLSLEP